jgi:hypothetical protein
MHIKTEAEGEIEINSGEIEMYNKIEYAILFTKAKGFEGYNTNNIKEIWNDRIVEGENKMIDVYYGVEIYVFKYNGNMYIVNIYDKEVKGWKAL